MITIFTPTYNRAYILPQLYESLKRQSNKNFEWIVVDDGSKDNTEELIKEWSIQQEEFSIKYIKQNNEGKHVAINKGIALANSEWFFIVDSDDYIVDEAVEKIHQWIVECKGKEFAGVAGTRINNKKVMIGDRILFNSPYIDCKNNERKKYGLGGDKAEVYKTSILKQYPFPKFNDEKFLSECSVWDHIAIDGYKLRWFNYPLTVCDYLSDGLTSKVNRLELENFLGYTYATKIRLKAYKGEEHYRIIAQYINKATHKGIKINEIAARINQNILLVYLLFVAVKVKNQIFGDKVI